MQEPRYSQLNQVSKAFPQYASYFAGGANGKTKGQSCPIFCRKDRFTLLDSGTFWYSDTPDRPGTKDWGNAVPRFCSWVQLAEKDRNVSFYVYNTHLDSISQNSREKSVRLLASQIAARKTEAPFVIIGDFNMKLMNPAMEFLLERSRQNRFPVVDAWLSMHPDNPHESTCNFGSWATGPQLDHIQLGSNAKPLAVEIDDRKVEGRYPSDHFPVIAQITIRPKAFHHIEADATVRDIIPPLYWPLLSPGARA